MARIDSSRMPTIHLEPAKKRFMIFAIMMMAIFMAFMGAVQFSTPDLPDNDGYYHIQMAYLMRTQGLKPAFPWLPLTILNPREYFDHHFLFHAALIPFTFSDLRVGAKIASVLFASLAFLCVWYLLYSQKVPFHWVWAIGILAVSEGFIYRLSVTRAQSLSLAFLALGLNWMLVGKHKRLMLLGFLYVWTYDAFVLLPITALLYAIGLWLVERRVDFKPFFYSALGVILGLFLNPYFPYDLIFIYRHLLPKLFDATAVRVGNEWYPYDTGQLLKNSPLSLLSFIAGVLALGLKGEKMDVRTSLALFTSILFGWMLFQARRFVEYFPAFSLVFAAFACTPIINRFRSPFPFSSDVQAPQGKGIKTRWDWRRYLERILSLGFILILVISGGLYTFNGARESMQRSKPYNLFAGASAWLKENTPIGERVFQTDWDDFPRLFFYNTHNTYLVGLDPTYLQLYDPELYETWVAITRGEIIQPSKVIFSNFGARYVISDLNHTGFLKKAREDPGMVEVYRDDQAVIYRVVD